MCQLRCPVLASLLSLLLIVAGGCRFSPDLGDARFACADDEGCPGGSVCVDGWCAAPGSPEGDGGAAGSSADAAASASASDFEYRQRLTFDNRGRGELVDVPVLIALDPDRFDYAAARQDGGDIQFRDPDGALLPHEIESWDPQGRSTLWVGVPSIDAGSAADHIWLLYGNSNLAVHDGDDEGVWSSYIAVYHMGQGDEEVDDSTAQRFDGVEVGASATPGLIGPAHAFDGVDQYIDLGAERDFLRSVPGATLELWVEPEDLRRSVPVAVSIHSTVAGSYPSRAQVIFSADGTVTGGARSRDEGAIAEVAAAAALTAGVWNWVVVVIDFAGDRIDLYVNGVPSAGGGQLGLLPGTPDTSSSQAIIGADEERDREFFAGLIDEVRIAGRAHGPDWISAQYAAMTGALITYSSPETQ